MKKVIFHLFVKCWNGHYQQGNIIILTKCERELHKKANQKDTNIFLITICKYLNKLLWRFSNFSHFFILKPLTFPNIRIYEFWKNVNKMLLWICYVKVYRIWNWRSCAKLAVSVNWIHDLIGQPAKVSDSIALDLDSNVRATF